MQELTTLSKAAHEVMLHQWSNSREAMLALSNLIELAASTGLELVNRGPDYLCRGLGAWTDDERRLLRLFTRCGVAEVEGHNIDNLAKEHAQNCGLPAPSPESYLYAIRTALDALIDEAEFRAEREMIR